MQSLLEEVKIQRLFAAITYSFKVIIRQQQRNVKSSAPLLPSHQWVIITILLLLSSSLTGWPALKYTLNRLQACTKWPIGSLLLVIKWKKKQNLTTRTLTPANTKLIVSSNLRRFWRKVFDVFFTQLYAEHKIAFSLVLEWKMQNIREQTFP